MSKSAHKPFIDGLRAVAIVAVMAFHVGIPYLSGGFIGVDVFFVISGFLIIGQLSSALTEGRHSLAEFWARRAMRILPPYLLVVAASMVLARFHLASPSERSDFASQVVWSAAMAANHYFLGQQGYFDTSADVKPLLHLWSLAVEEQFYLVAPLILSGYWMAQRGLASARAQWLVRLGVPLALSLGSFVLCIRYTGGAEEPNYAFFLMPLRAWEFIAGGALPLAARAIGSTRKVWGSALPVAGLALIVGAVVGYSEATQFPSFAALVPVLGASAIIVGGLVQGSSRLVRALGSRPFTAVGLISYSWYLWHWPLLAFVRVSNFGERRLGPDALAALVSLVLAIATYWLVERPIRVWRQKTKPTLGWAVTAMGLTACGAMAWVGALERPALPVVASEDDDGSEKEASGTLAVCDFRLQTTFGACMAASSGRRLGLVAGDSHASGIFRLLTEGHPDEQRVISRSTSRGCSPLFGVRPAVIKDQMWSDRCSTRKRALDEALGEGAYVPEFVILSAYWHTYTKGGARAVVMDPKDQDTDSDEVFQAQLRATLERFLASGVQRVLVVGPTPELRKPVPQCAAQAEHQGADVNKKCGGGKASLKRARRTLKLLRNAASGLPRVEVIDPVPSLCIKEVCSAAQGKDLLYLDRHHLSETGLERMYRGNERAFRWVLGEEK